MSAGNFPACLAITLSYEGGYSDHPRDPGGATMKGVTLAVYRKEKPGATKADLRAITDAEIQKIYRKGYWNPVRGDSLPDGVDLVTWDFSVNSGVSRGAKALQSSVGVVADGAVGPKTLEAVAKKNPVDLVKAICARRMSFVKGLSTFSTFGRGWSRRIADVEARGVKMASGAAAAVVMAKEATTASKRAGAQDSAAIGSGATGGGAVMADQVGSVDWMVILAVVVVAGVLAVILKSRANWNKDRAEAYARVAAEG